MRLLIVWRSNPKNSFYNATEPFNTTEPKQAGPTAWPGIAEARVIGNKTDHLHAPGRAMAAPQHLLNFLPLRQGQ
jgi:hypothetical protein